MESQLKLKYFIKDILINMIGIIIIFILMISAFLKGNLNTRILLSISGFLLTLITIASAKSNYEDLVIRKFKSGILKSDKIVVINKCSTSIFVGIYIEGKLFNNIELDINYLIKNKYIKISDIDTDKLIKDNTKGSN